MYIKSIFTISFLNLEIIKNFMRATFTSYTEEIEKLLKIIFKLVL